MSDNKAEIRTAARELAGFLNAQLKLTNRLYACACRKEQALVENDLDTLKAALDDEEELVQEFAKNEKSRIASAEKMGKLLGSEQKGNSLRDLFDKMGDAQTTVLLKTLRIQLAEAVRKTQEKNSAVQNILTLKNEYAETMLRILSNTERDDSQNYGINGQIVELLGDPEKGLFEVLA